MPATVLVVDDQPDIRNVIAAILEAEGYRVTTAANGREALDRLAAQPPALVLLDLHTPVMNGWELQRRLATDEPRIAVVFMTAGEQACIEAERHGAAGCLPKPFELDDLVDVVRRFAS
jgi:CheY-like chemotaxis protein